MSKNIIMINRGDTYKFDLDIADNDAENGRYILKDNDVLYLGVMYPYQPFEDALIKKRFTKEDCDEMGNLTVVIEPSDTLDLIPGVYYYAVKLHKQTDNEIEHIDEVITVINRTKFVIFE